MIVKQVKEIIVKEEIEVKTTAEVQQEQKTTAETHHRQIVEKEWKKIQELAVYKEARSTTLVKHIEKDVAEMTRTSSEGRLHMMSWLSCHWWQRATCTTMSHYTESFRACSSKTMMLAEDNGSAPWWMWLVGVLLLVLMVILLGRFLYNRRRWPVPAVRPTALDVVGKHPQWPTMVSDLDVVLKTAKEDKIISFFKEKGASPRDMNQQIDQYLYMAILYASVLRARYDGTSAFSEEVVRRHAEVYIQSMLTRTKRGALPFLQVSSTEAMTKTMSQYLYSTIVQTEVLVTIRPPEDIIIVHPEIIERDRKIKDLQKENDRLREEIAKLRKKRDSCCQRANDCEKANAKYNGWGSP
ncbi:unnamed protein product [Urochloa humidicola]